jgi:hypothetical protein
VVGAAAGAQAASSNASSKPQTTNARVRRKRVGWYIEWVPPVK